MIAYHLGVLAVNIGENLALFAVDPVHGIVKAKNMVATADDLLIHGCEKFQEIPEDELITHATAFGVEMASMHYGEIALGKLLTAAGAAARISGFLEKVLELLGPIKEELEQICKAVKKSFKAEPELAFAAESGEVIGSGVRSATQGLAEGPGEVATVPKVEKTIEFFEKNIKHIFRNAEGHLLDTPENRRLLLEVVADANNYLGVDRFGNQWFAKILANGKQVWASVRKNLIRNAGLNEIPEIFNDMTGLCKGNHYAKKTNL